MSSVEAAPLRIELRRPAVPEADLVSGWALTPAETNMWCLSDIHPVPPETVASWWEPDDVEPYVAVEADNLPMAYGELWLDEREDEVELARLIVGPTMRGVGVGRLLVAALVVKAGATGLGAVILRLDPRNERAFRCYVAGGFRPLDARRNAEWNRGQRVTYTWMELER